MKHKRRSTAPKKKASTDGISIKEIDGTLEADHTAFDFEEEMATLTEQEEEALRVEKVRYEQACHDVKARHKEEKVQRSRDKPQRQREKDLLSKRQELQQQRAQTQNEKFRNLTLAKAQSYF